MHCPKCKSAAIHRSRSRSRWEVWRKELTHKRAFRCSECNWRWWAFDEGLTLSDPEFDRALAPEPPNLAGTVLAHDDAPTDSIDLTALDAATADIPEKS